MKNILRGGFSRANSAQSLSKRNAENMPESFKVLLQNKGESTKNNENAKFKNTKFKILKRNLNKVE